MFSNSAQVKFAENIHKECFLVASADTGTCTQPTRFRVFHINTPESGRDRDVHAFQIARLIRTSRVAESLCPGDICKFASQTGSARLNKIGVTS